MQGDLHVYDLEGLLKVRKPGSTKLVTSCKFPGNRTGGGNFME